MNCYCYPPKHAVIKKVQKTGPNYGRDFFSCSTGTCNLFHMVDNNRPMALNQNLRQHNENNNNIQTKSFSVKFNILSFEFNPKLVIWTGISCTFHPRLNQSFSNLDKSQCYYSNSLKMWIFDFLIYDQIIFIVTKDLEGIAEELPRFIVFGLKHFIQRINSLNLDQEFEVNITPKLQETLLPFQLDGIKFAISRGGRALIGDDMGNII